MAVLTTKLSVRNNFYWLPLLAIIILAISTSSRNLILSSVGSSQLSNDNNQITSIEIIDRGLNQEELLRLGLTPKNSYKIIKVDGTSQIIHGRFLHITDMHPDMFYKENTSIDSTACHSGEGDASKYGDAMAGCDSPYILVKETLEWIEKNLKNKIDFVVWTGDNVRHDNDRQIPRTEEQIFDTNLNMSVLMNSIFKGDRLDPRDFQVPLIPSLGNNDVYPHNLFAVGPTLQSRLLYKTWSGYISQEQIHIFEKYACFFSEIIPGKLAVLSINTLYFFKSNPLVDNCDKKSQPGYSLFLWLGYSLKELRRRGMKVWLTGHVPPVPKNYDLTCYRKYVLWLYAFRDVIVGNLFGHMNLDHFVPLDGLAAYDSLKKDKLMPGYEDLMMAFQELDNEEDENELFMTLNQLYENFGLKNDYSDGIKLSKELNTLGAAPGVNKLDYMDTVNKVFYSDLLTSDKKKKQNKKQEDVSKYSIIHIAGSVIPTFNPAFRIWEYNVTNLLNEQNEIKTKNEDFESWDEFHKILDEKIEKLKKNDNSYNKEYFEIFGTKRDKSFPPKYPKDVQLGPAYIPQTFTPTRFIQYYLDLKSVNEERKPFNYEIEYTNEDLSLDSLLVRDWVDLGIDLSKDKKKWSKFLKKVFVNTDYENLVKSRKDSESL